MSGPSAEGSAARHGPVRTTRPACHGARARIHAHGQGDDDAD